MNKLAIVLLAALALAGCAPRPRVVIERSACPVGYHLGPAGMRCWPN